jgi:type IV pilus assembly protein PilX
MMTIRQYKNQTGFTLIMSLLILVVLTILGLTSTQSTRNEVAMAGNLRESDMAFQVAEMGLSSGEQFVETSSSNTSFNDSNGLISKNGVDPDYFDSTSWSSVQTSTATIANVYTQPKYIIKYLGDRSQNEVALVNIGGYGTAQPGITVSNYRVTSKGSGQTDSAARMIQSYYGKE